MYMPRRPRSGASGWYDTETPSAAQMASSPSMVPPLLYPLVPTPFLLGSYDGALDDQLRLGRQRFAWLHPLLGVMVCDSYARQWCRVIDAAEKVMHGGGKQVRESLNHVEVKVRIRHSVQFFGGATR